MLATDTVSAETVDEIVELPLDKIHPHPANDPARIDVERLGDLIPLIDQHGQREPAEVRPLEDPPGHYQLTSGHRRWASARALGLDVLRVRIREMSDREALQAVALGNAGRKDLDPIQRARLLDEMVGRVEHGGAGMDRLEAGAIFGIESESGVKNAIRLLSLPPFLQQRVADGRLPVACARAIVPYAHAEELMRRLEKELRKDAWFAATITDRDRVSWSMERFARHETRPVDGKTKHDYGYQDGQWPRLFALDDRSPREFRIVALPLGKNGKTVEVAQNTKAFDKLNRPLIQEAKKRKEKAGSRKAKASTKLTPAEEKRKAKEQAERLEKRRHEWRYRFLRCLLVQQTGPGHPVIDVSLPWLFAHVGHGCYGTRATLTEWVAAAITLLGVETRRSEYGGVDTSDLLDTSIAVGLEPFDTNLPPGGPLLVKIWRLLIWPQNEKSVGDLVTTGIPARLVALPDACVDRLVICAGTDLAGGWEDGTVDDSPERHLIAELLDHHTTTQLRELAAELCGVPIATTSKKSDLTAFLMSAHRPGSPLPMPKFLQPTKKGGRKK